MINYNCAGTKRSLAPANTSRQFKRKWGAGATRILSRLDLVCWCEQYFFRMGFMYATGAKKKEKSVAMSSTCHEKKEEKVDTNFLLVIDLSFFLFCTALES